MDRDKFLYEGEENRACETTVPCGGCKGTGHNHPISDKCPSCYGAGVDTQEFKCPVADLRSQLQEEAESSKRFFSLCEEQADEFAVKDKRIAELESEDIRNSAIICNLQATTNQENERRR